MKDFSYRLVLSDLAYETPQWIVNFVRLPKPVPTDPDATAGLQGSEKVYYPTGKLFGESWTTDPTDNDLILAAERLILPNWEKDGMRLEQRPDGSVVVWDFEKETPRAPGYQKVSDELPPVPWYAALLLMLIGFGLFGMTGVENRVASAAIAITASAWVVGSAFLFVLSF